MTDIIFDLDALYEASDKQFAIPPLGRHNYIIDGFKRETITKADGTKKPGPITIKDSNFNRITLIFKNKQTQAIINEDFDINPQSKIFWKYLSLNKAVYPSPIQEQKSKKENAKAIQEAAAKRKNAMPNIVRLTHTIQNLFVGKEVSFSTFDDKYTDTATGKEKSFRKISWWGKEEQSDGKGVLPPISDAQDAIMVDETVSEEEVVEQKSLQTISNEVDATFDGEFETVDDDEFIDEIESKNSEEESESEEEFEEEVVEAPKKPAPKKTAKPAPKKPAPKVVDDEEDDSYEW